MSRYRVIINGRNFLLRFTDQEQRKEKYGFYTTRDVEASSVEEAEENAIELIRNEERIASLTLNPRDDPPMLYVDEIWMPDDDEEPASKTGYSYYREDNES